MRETNVTPKFANNSVVLQEKLHTMWLLIEDMYPEEWCREANGDITLEVDDAMLERILKDNVATAWYQFGSNAGGMREDGSRFFLRRPEHLKGTYTIKGIYDENQRFINHARRYFFTQEGY